MNSNFIPKRKIFPLLILGYIYDIEYFIFLFFFFIVQIALNEPLMPAEESQKAFDIDLPMPDYLLLKCSPKDSSNLISTRYSDSEITAIGKKYALRK